MRQNARHAAIGIDVCTETSTPCIAQNGSTGLGHLFISAGMIRTGTRVDDAESNPVSGAAPLPVPCRTCLPSQRHQNRPGRTKLNGNVRTCACNHVEILPKLHYIQILATRGQPRLSEEDNASTNSNTGKEHFGYLLQHGSCDHLRPASFGR
jgi:hypothetical protein